MVATLGKLTVPTISMQGIYAVFKFQKNIKKREKLQVCDWKQAAAFCMKAILLPYYQ